MRKANRVVRNIIITALAAFAAVAPGVNAAELKFRAAPGSEPVVGHYLVRLDDSISGDAARGSAEALARAYGGQLEIYTSSDVRRFAIVMLPARARTLSADPRVREVVGTAQGDDALTPPPASAASLSTRLVPGALDSSSSGTYLYDGSGNIKSIGSDAFSYDVNGRLKQATVLGNQQTFTYDPFGNRATAVRANGAVGCVGGCDLPVTPNQQTNHIAEASYDVAGNATSLNDATYSFDGTGMVTRAIVGTDDRMFLYTADDERIGVRQGSSWTWSVRDQSGKVLREFSSLETSSSPLALSSHTWTKDYVWRDGQLLASVFPTTQGTISPTTTYHYHLDHLGTPRLVTKELGVLVGKHAYYPFGAEMDLTPKEATTELMKFTGHERDIVAGAGNSVDYMHARYYNPAFGRFLSVDPKGRYTEQRRPQAWNRYVYSLDNPLLLVDPDGRDPRISTLFANFGNAFEHLRNAGTALAHVPIINAQLKVWGTPGGEFNVGKLDGKAGADIRIKADVHGEIKAIVSAQATVGSIGPQFQASLPLLRNGQAFPDGARPQFDGAAIYRGGNDSPDNGAKTNLHQATVTGNAGSVALQVGVDYGQAAQAVMECGAAARELVKDEGAKPDWTKESSLPP